MGESGRAGADLAVVCRGPGFGEEGGAIDDEAGVRNGLCGFAGRL